MGEWLSSIDIVTAEYSSSMSIRDVVIVWYDLKLRESNTVVESYRGEYQPKC